MEAVSTVEAGALVGPAGMDRVRQLVAEGHWALWLDNGMPMLLGGDTAERLLTAPEVAAPVAMIVLEGMSGITSGPLHELWSELMFGKDGDEHRELRDRVAHELTPKAVERLRPHVVEHADELLDRALATGVLEVHDDYALPLAAAAQAELLGIPGADLVTVVPWALRLVYGFGPMTPEVAQEVEGVAVEFCALPRRAACGEATGARRRSHLVAAGAGRRERRSRGCVPADAGVGCQLDVRRPRRRRQGGHQHGVAVARPPRHGRAGTALSRQRGDRRSAAVLADGPRAGPGGTSGHAH
jgi:hypothetical protein